MIEHLFGSKTRLKLLYLFFNDPDKSMYVREIARLTGVQLNAVRREIANLEKTGLLVPLEASQVKTDEIIGERAKYYGMQKDFSLYEPLRDLLFKAHLLEEQELIERLRTRAGEVKYMLLTGFFTGEKEVQADLLLVGNFKPVVLSRLLKDFEKILGRAIRYTVMDEKEFRERREIGDKFLYSLLEAKHLTVVDEIGLS